MWPFFRNCYSFFKSPNLQKKIFQKTILNLKFKIPAHNIILFWAGILNFKFKIVFWNIFFFEIWRSKKRIALSETKPHFKSLLSYCTVLKVAFFRKCGSFFKSPNLQKKIFQKTILNLKFKIPVHNIILALQGKIGDGCVGA